MVKDDLTFLQHLPVSLCILLSLPWARMDGVSGKRLLSTHSQCEWHTAGTHLQETAERRDALDRVRHLLSSMNGPAQWAG